MGEEKAGRGPRRGAEWALVLAAGDGTRLAALTRGGDGSAVPKQFCSLRGERSLLQAALRRAERLVPRERVVTVVASSHRRWWRDELAGRSDEDVIVQPANRGTAAGILLPLLRILRRDPGATVAIVPSDHHVAREWTLQVALGQAMRHATKEKSIVLLGITATEADSGFGWIVPEEDGGEPRPVRRFREKPDAAEAGRLLRGGAVLNSFLFTASARLLLDLFLRLLPEVANPLAPLLAGDEVDLEAVYEDLPQRDFSRHLLERAADLSRVWRVPPCGWSDLGTPERVARCLREAPAAAAPPDAHRRQRRPLDLARRLAAARPAAPVGP